MHSSPAGNCPVGTGVAGDTSCDNTLVTELFWMLDTLWKNSCTFPGLCLMLLGSHLRDSQWCWFLTSAQSCWWQPPALKVMLCFFPVSSASLTKAMEQGKTSSCQSLPLFSSPACSGQGLHYLWMQRHHSRTSCSVILLLLWILDLFQSLLPKTVLHSADEVLHLHLLRPNKHSRTGGPSLLLKILVWIII